MQVILNQPGIDLDDFFCPESENDIFPTATTYPTFFDENLLSSSRVIKHFPDDPHCNIRVFYYNLLKLSYEFYGENNEAIDFPLTNFKNRVFSDKFEIRFSR